MTLIYTWNNGTNRKKGDTIVFFLLPCWFYSLSSEPKREVKHDIKIEKENANKVAIILKLEL